MSYWAHASVNCSRGSACLGSVTLEQGGMYDSETRRILQMSIHGGLYQNTEWDEPTSNLDQTHQMCHNILFRSLGLCAQLAIDRLASLCLDRSAFKGGVVNRRSRHVGRYHPRESKSCFTSTTSTHYVSQRWVATTGVSKYTRVDISFNKPPSCHAPT